MCILWSIHNVCYTCPSQARVTVLHHLMVQQPWPSNPVSFLSSDRSACSQCMPSSMQLNLTCGNSNYCNPRDLHVLTLACRPGRSTHTSVNDTFHVSSQPCYFFARHEYSLSRLDCVSLATEVLLSTVKLISPECKCNPNFDCSVSGKN